MPVQFVYLPGAICQNRASEEIGTPTRTGLPTEQHYHAITREQLFQQPHLGTASYKEARFFQFQHPNARKQLPTQL
jgi:hypothetical protein